MKSCMYTRLFKCSSGFSKHLEKNLEIFSISEKTRKKPIIFQNQKPRKPRKQPRKKRSGTKQYY